MIYEVILLKIILSPSKTTEYQKSNYLTDKVPLYPKKTKKILAQLKKKSKKQLAESLKLSTKLLESTFSDIKNYEANPTYHAFVSFNGLVFKQLQLANYTKEDFLYVEEHVRILDAFYGVLEPGTLIKPYRLDMKAKIDLDLYHFWNISTYFQDEVIVNLASNEFSSMINLPMIQIQFLQRKEDTYINQATYSKMGRGMFLDYLVQNKVKTVAEMKLFQAENYQYNPSLSNDNTIVFTR